ncbi:hypothetical protein ACFW93_17290 [Streptomyces canus]|uniref:hypothetical protein n=1 Tax=Streptomyces canus TaxID=58343 RepID=UPI003675F571
MASGIENNYLGTDQGAGAGGRAALTRLDRDVLSVPGIRTVVVTQGLEDIVAGHDDVDIDNALGLLRDQLKGWGIKVVFTTLTPCDGYSPCTTEALKLGNDAVPADFDSGDHVNLTSDGYSTISNAYDLASLGPDA